MPNFLNEKTMEINLSSELTRFLSLFGYHVVWRGFTQQEEDRFGADVATLLPSGRVFFIQWKVVKNIDRRGDFKFKLDDAQMQKLTRLAGRNRSYVFYGFPSVHDWAAYRRASFFALPSTRFMGAYQLRNHPSLGKQGSHTGTLNSALTQVTVTSIPKIYDAMSVEEMFGLEPISNFKRFFSGYPYEIYGLTKKDMINPMWSNIQSSRRRKDSIRTFIEKNFLSSEDFKGEELRNVLKDYLRREEGADRLAAPLSGLYYGMITPYLDLI